MLSVFPFRKSTIGCLTILISLLGCQVRNSVGFSNLRCEYQTNPIGLDVSNPRFTWETKVTPDNGAYYVLNIATKESLLTKNTPDVLMSGKIASASYTPENKITIESFNRYYWNVVLKNKSGKIIAKSKTAFFETGFMTRSEWQAKWITDEKDKDAEPAPLFRKKFNLPEKPINSATLFISGLGYYEAFINGNRVGTNVLDPAYTAFDKRVYYASHDVKALVQQGKNAIAVVVGNGWYNEQSVAVWNFHHAAWRNRPRLLCELIIKYKDGSVERIGSDQTWRTSTGGYIYNNLYSGDMYDARLDEPGWKTPEFNDDNWVAATLVENFTPVIQSQLFPPVRETEQLNPISFTKRDDTSYVYQFAQNFSGYTQITVEGESGTEIRLIHGEILDSLGHVNQKNIDVYYHPVHKKERFQTDVFFLKGIKGGETFKPSFSYHGFRFVEVWSSKPVLLTKESVVGYFVHTDLQPVGKFKCSDETLNRLWEATNRSFLSNLHSIPTDCPQREKNGWTADAHVAVEAALLNYDGIAIYEKWLRDFIDNQNKKGQISGIIPSGGWGYEDWIGPVWDAALFIIPEALYNYYGDTRAIKQLYPTMQKYLAYLQTREQNGLLKYGLGDWLTYNTTTPNAFTSTAYYYLDNKLMAKFATLLGKDAAFYQNKANNLKQLINERFYNPTKHKYANGSQTAQALALYLGLVPKSDERQVAQTLAKIIVKNDGFLDFGLLGTKTVPRMLTKYGYGELALKMITRNAAPSWGHWVNRLNYTTLPETWTLAPNLKDGSLNHVFFGDVSAWMFRYLAGINFDENNPGFRHIIIEPWFVSGISWVEAEYKSVRGLIKSKWCRGGNAIEMEVEIPAGSSATVILPGGTPQTIQSGKSVFRYNDHTGNTPAKTL